MSKTIQLYTDDNKTIKGYPITSPDRVIDENGKNIKTVIQEFSEQLDKIENYEIFIKTIGEKDITSIIKGALAGIEKGIINIPKGDFIISEDIIINKPIILNGAGSSTTNINLINDASIIFTGDDNTQTYLSLSGLGINRITLNKEVLNIRDCLQFIYVARGNCNDLVINRSGGNGIYFRSSQDMSFYNCYFRYCGNFNNNKSAIFFDEYKQGHSSNNNVNEIKFVSCSFEHENGRLFISKGRNNNSNTCTDCKFEYSTTRTETPILLENADRFSFNECRYTHYLLSGMFELKNCIDTNITGLGYNSTDTNIFAKISNCKNIKIDVIGRKVGLLSDDGSNVLIRNNIIDKERMNYYLNENPQIQ